MAGRHLVSTLLVKNLLPVTTRDALELHIEDITGAEVVDIKYTNGETEAIVKLNKTIILDGETHRTISGNDVRIVPEINITKTLNCPPAKCDLLNMLLPQLKSSHQDCSFKMVTEGIELSGASRSVNKALLDLSEQVFTFDVRAISDVQSQKAKLLWSKRGKQEIKSLFRNAGIRAALSVRNGQLWLSATDSDKVSEAAMLLEENIHMVKIPVGHLHQKFFHSDKWTQFIDDLKRKYSVSIEKGSSEIVLVALGDCYGKMKKQVDDTLKSSAQDTREIPLAEEDWNLLRTYYQEEVEALGSKSDDGTGSIQVTLATTGNGKGVIKVSGDTILLQDVKTKIMKFLERIIHQTDDYSIPGLAKHFSEGLGATIISGIQTKCNSFIRVTVGEEADDEEGDEEDVLETEEEPETTSEAGYKASKVALEVEQGDIATLKADVLVNTPSGQDMDLTKCGQIADAFCKTGGEKMQQLYDAAVGDGVDVVMTRACGNLQCTQVFHVRIDSLRRNKYSYERLEADIYKCLQKASQLQANSIVFPTVGCGGLRFDPREVVQCFKRAVKKHGSDASCCISKVIIAAYGNDVYLNFVQLVGSPNASQPVPARPQRPTRTRRTTTHNRSSQPRHSSTVFFHITALGQSHIADTLNQLEHSINEYTAKETVQVEYLEMFTGDEIEKITSLGSEEVRVFIETPQQKCFHLVGSKQAMTAIVGAVQQKVQETQGKEEFMLRNGDRSTYLNYIANRPEEIPAHWKTLNQRDETAASKVSVDSVVANAIKVVVQRTWQQHLTTKGQDAAGLSHTTIEVTDVEQIENPHLYFKYERTKKEFCALAAKGIHSFPKVTSDPDEKDDVMTSTKGIKLLDDQLIPDINEYFLFHGAPQQYIESILRQGIDFRLNSRGMFGKGAYFGESSTKADQYADDKHNRTSGPHSMFLCKVILGHSHIAKAPASDLQRPPCLHHCAGACVCGPSDFHNSVVGTHRDGGHRLLFREFVIYEQSQIYPAYLITYKRE